MFERLAGLGLAILTLTGCATVPKAKLDERRAQREAALAVIPTDLPQVREALSFVWEMSDAQLATARDPSDDFCAPDVADGHRFHFHCLSSSRLSTPPRLKYKGPPEDLERRARLAKPLLELPWSGLLSRDILTARTMYLLARLHGWEKEEWRVALEARISERFSDLEHDWMRWPSLAIQEPYANEKIRAFSTVNIELTHQLSVPIDEVLRRFVGRGPFRLSTEQTESLKRYLDLLAPKAMSEMERELLRRVSIQKPPPFRATWEAPDFERLLVAEPDADLREYWSVMLALAQAQPADAPDLSSLEVFAAELQGAGGLGAKIALARDPRLLQRIEAVASRLTARSSAGDPVEEAALGHARATTEALRSLARPGPVPGAPPNADSSARGRLALVHLLRSKPSLGLAALLAGRPLSELEPSLVPTARSLLAKLRVARSGPAADVLTWMDGTWTMDVSLRGSDADTKALEECLPDQGLVASPQSSLSVWVLRGTPKVSKVQKTVTVRKTASDREAEYEALDALQRGLEEDQRRADAQNRRTERLIHQVSFREDLGQLRENDQDKFQQIKNDYYSEKYAGARANQAAWRELEGRKGKLMSGFDGEPTKQVTRTYETHSVPLKMNLTWAGEPPEEWTTWANYSSKPKMEEVAKKLGCEAARELRRAWVARKMYQLATTGKAARETPTTPADQAAAAFAAGPSEETLRAFLRAL